MKREVYLSHSKEGNEKRDPKGYTPTIVLHIDYKLYATILAKRLSVFMPSLKDQTGFTGNRQTYDSIRKAIHITDHKVKGKLVQSSSA